MPLNIVTGVPYDLGYSIDGKPVKGIIYDINGLTKENPIDMGIGNIEVVKQDIQHKVYYSLDFRLYVSAAPQDEPLRITCGVQKQQVVERITGTVRYTNDNTLIHNFDIQPKNGSNSSTWSGVSYGDRQLDIINVVVHYFDGTIVNIPDNLAVDIIAGAPYEEQFVKTAVPEMFLGNMEDSEDSNYNPFIPVEASIAVTSDGKIKSFNTDYDNLKLFLTYHEVV